ncbi:antitoxin HicB [Corynebacterium sp. sy017]|uniref:antitoxin HicB n=1 Tax=unclassified Corynebacterium TaxID=2624378 RepID=UPI0011857C75|nr:MULTISPECIES: antitoxin HicB [unclassified Corynebacterium]MBP3089098.1 antitoxin HicB [Corynebacterium sp. sy017]TSD91412.1 antitoxin HicB [Corynebacterium sp. SY003]
MDASKYTYQVSWSEIDQEYVATVTKFPSLSWLDADPQQAKATLIKIVDGILADMKSTGEEIP